MNIQAKIKRQGYTVAQVAAQMKKKSGGIGISQGSLSTILNGNPTIDKLKEVADIIGVSLSELVDDNDATGQCAVNAEAVKLEHRIARLEKVVGEILQEVKSRSKTDDVSVMMDGITPILNEIKQKTADIHQDLRSRGTEIKAECEGISQDFRNLFSLLDDKL